MSVAEARSRSVGAQRPSRVVPTVLVIENDRDLRIRLTEQLTEIGIMPAVARNGYEGVRMAGAMRPGLVVIDGLLAEMHGFEVARFIRALDPNYRPHIAMITAISKHTRYHNEAKLKYGIDDYVMKPVSDAALAGIVSKLTKE
ncbi:MAG TPA: response regulator [Thermoanaerobaculia bacterium]|nr:response regulator [Thermoanaerobaculia bacterium]